MVEKITNNIFTPATKNHRHFLGCTFRRISTCAAIVASTPAAPTTPSFCTSRQKRLGVDEIKYQHTREESRMPNSIKIYLRVRPTTKPSDFFEVVNEADDGLLAEEEKSSAANVLFRLPQDGTAGLVNNTRTSYKFQFDAMLAMDVKQDEVFRMVAKESVLAALDGFNATVFAYGQTGSGKTFSITGGAERYVDRGIIPRAISLIFQEFTERSDTKFTAYISYLEIYNESGYDLLDPQHDQMGTKMTLEELPKVTMLEDDDGNVHLRGLSMHLANSEEDALNLLFLGDTNRAISETPMNLASSRSHCVFTVSMEARQAGSDVIRRSKLHLVDLAGSERVHKTNAGGQVLREAKYINTSLHYLEMVIVALHERSTKGRQHIPYRNSMLTSVLRDSLGGNCKTAMIATINAEAPHTDESISTCRFAQRVALVQNDAMLNEEVDPSLVIKRLKMEIVKLKEELSFLKLQQGGDDMGGGELTEHERGKLETLITGFVEDGAADARLTPGRLTYEIIQYCFGSLRSRVLGSVKSSGGSRNSPAGGPRNASNGAGNGTSNDTQAVRDLRDQLQQRDNEIAILVNMVKKGGAGKANVPTPAKNRGVPAAAHAVAGGGARHRSTPNVDGLDVRELKDRRKMLELFKSHHSGTSAIDENKRILRTKYVAAKATGENVNRARSNINRIKQRIEQLRASRLLRRRGVAEGKDDESKGEEGKDDEAGEMEMKRAIEHEKHVYKQSFQHLRQLKAEIERIQSTLEKCRLKMQCEFEAWHAELLAERNAAEDGGGEAPGVRDPHGGGRSGNGGLLGMLQTRNSAQKHGLGSASGRGPAASPVQAWSNGGALAANSASAAKAPDENGPVQPFLTGNAEADADILAFYKAKAEIIQELG